MLKIAKMTIKRAACLSIATVLFVSTSPLSLAVASGAIADATSTLTFQEGIEAAVVSAFVGLAEELSPEVTAAITPEVEAIAASAQASVLAIKEKKESIETNGFVLENIVYPPAEEINRIPEQYLAKVRAEVEAEIRSGIAADFANSEVLISEQVKALMVDSVPGLIKEFEPALKALIPKVHIIIEARIEERIEQKILLALPELMPLIPENMSKMSPEEIAAEVKASIKDKVEAQVRPEFEAKIKAQVDALMVEKIKKPIEEKFQPRLSSLDTSVYDSYIDQLPDYLERVVSKATIKSIVSENIVALKARLPVIVENFRTEIDEKINQYIQETVESEAKVYIGQSYVKAPIRPTRVNDRLLVPFRAIATALGATVEWRYAEQQVVMVKGDTTVVLTINSNVVLVNGKETTIDAAAQLVDDYTDPSISHTVVPLRFLAETFNMKVDWQEQWQMVTIS